MNTIKRVSTALAALRRRFRGCNSRQDGRHGLIIPIIAGVVSLAIIVAMVPTYSDTGFTTYWEAAGLLRGEAVWQMTQAAYARSVGNERLIVPPKHARTYRGGPRFGGQVK